MKVFKFCEVWTLMSWGIFNAVNEFNQFVGEPEIGGKVAQSIEGKVSFIKEL